MQYSFVYYYINRYKTVCTIEQKMLISNNTYSTVQYMYVQCTTVQYYHTILLLSSAIVLVNRVDLFLFEDLPTIMHNHTTVVFMYGNLKVIVSKF